LEQKKIPNTQFKKGRTPWNKGLKGVYKLSEETRRKISESLKGRTSWWKGKHHSEETKAKISASNKGRYQPPRDGKNNGMYGKTHSLETKEKMSDTLKHIWSERERKGK
jgi:group I intron endonuclease